MKGFKEFIRRTPVIRDVAMFLVRLKTGAAFSVGVLVKVAAWLVSSRETVNYTYELMELNKRYLASLIANVTGKQFQEIIGYISELENDIDLRNHILKTIQESKEKHFADKNVHYGRRLGWYAIARAVKPKVIVETGVDKGLGSCVLTAALIQNEREGYPGYYYGTDINPKAGYLLSGLYRRYGEVLYGDSIASLETLDKAINLFVNDSDHSAEYEAREYALVAGKLGERAILLGDNSHATNALLEFSLATNRHFLFFQEKPLAHWYPGAGIGISFQG